MECDLRTHDTSASDDVFWPDNVVQTQACQHACYGWLRKVHMLSYAMLHPADDVENTCFITAWFAPT